MCTALVYIDVTVLVSGDIAQSPIALLTVSSHAVFLSGMKRPNKMYKLWVVALYLRV